MRTSVSAGIQPKEFHGSKKEEECRQQTNSCVGRYKGAREDVAFSIVDKPDALLHLCRHSGILFPGDY